MKNKLYVLSFLMVLFVVLKSLFFSTFDSDLYILKKLPIYLIILLLALPIENKKGVLISFILSTGIVNLISIYEIGQHIYTQNNFEIASGEKINEILVVERLYFGLINSLSVGFSIVLINNKLSPKIKRWLVLGVVLSVFVVFLVVSRIAILAILIVFVINLFKKAAIKKTILLMGVAFVGVLSLFFLNDNLSKRFFHSDKKKDFFHKVREWEPRYVIWNCVYSIFTESDNLLTGTGYSDTQEKLNNCYIDFIQKEKREQWFVKRRFNTHNQYLDFLLCTGIIGLLIFLALQYELFRLTKKNTDLLNILLIIVLFGCVENFFHRQVGVYLFSLIIVGTVNNEFSKPKMKTSS
ncbi:O-antigen ligase [Winogradskyella sp.]|uniref:O-antigen ligase family protein n=1 Tax=Winogradskyella sp. TaxID=1883156 RepID=UPI00260B3F17|nr:O-antigen ligase family protein [Winogradskyella sp.]